MWTSGLVPTNQKRLEAGTLVDLKDFVPLQCDNSRTYTVKTPAGALTGANYEKKRKNYTKNPPIVLARIQQYSHFA